MVEWSRSLESRHVVRVLLSLFSRESGPIFFSEAVLSAVFDTWYTVYEYTCRGYQ